MTIDIDIEQLLDEHYADGSARLPRPVLEAAIAEIGRVPQRGPGVAGRLHVVSPMVRLLVAAGLLLAVAAIGALLAGSRRDAAIVDVSPPPLASTRPAASPVASAQPAASPFTSLIPSPQPTASAVPSQQPGIFVEVPRVPLKGAPSGPLSGLVMAPDVVRVVRSDRGVVTVSDVSRGVSISPESRLGRPMAWLGEAVAVGWQSGDRVVTLSYSNGTPMVLRRFLADGTDDPTFGEGGSVVASFPGRPMHPEPGVGAAGMVIGPDGSIVMLGGTSFAIARFSADGQLDTAFGDAGQVTTDVGLGQDHAFAAAVQGDGKIVVVGQTGFLTAGPVDNDMVVLRLLPDGKRDATFGTDGVTRVHIASTTTDSGRAVVMQPDGRIVVLGTDGDRQLFVVRLDADGRLDPSFRSDATLRPHSEQGAPIAIAIADDGRLAVLAERGLYGFDAGAYPDRTLGGALGIRLP